MSSVKKLEILTTSSENLTPDPLEVFLGGYRSPQTRAAYANDLRLFFDYLASIRVAPPHVKPLHVTQYLASIHEGVAPKTFNRRLGTIRAFYKWAANNDLIPSNPTKGIRYESAQPVNPTTALTDKEAKSLMDAPKSNSIVGASDRLALVLMFHLGLRRAELVDLKWEHIKEERGVALLEIYGKGRKVRQIPLTKKVLEELKVFQAIYFSKTKISLESSHYIIQRFKVPSEKPTHPSTILKMMKKYAKILGINKPIGTHSCRATVISQLLEKGESVRNVQAFAGHSSPYTTMLYDKKRDGLKNSSAFKVDFDNDSADISKPKKD